MNAEAIYLTALNRIINHNSDITGAPDMIQIAKNAIFAVEALQALQDYSRRQGDV